MPPSKPNVGRSVEALLLEAATLADEAREGLLEPTEHEAIEETVGAVSGTRADLDELLELGPREEGEPSASDVESSAGVTAEDTTEEVVVEDREQEFRDACDRGVDALLRRAFPEARAAFERANDLKPGDRLVVANLDRLEAMGVGRDPDEE